MKSTTFDWNKYLEIATKLHADDLPENNRTCVSRAYYCIYNLMRQLDPSLEDSNGSIHIKFWRNCIQKKETCQSQEARQAWIRIGTDGEQLRKMRTDADYDGKTVVTTAEAQRALNFAKSIIGKMKFIQPTAP